MCVSGLCGPECNLNDPCQEENICLNQGVCIENCGVEPHYICNCTDGFTGTNCSEVVNSFYYYLAGAYDGLISAFSYPITYFYEE